ncbi:MAG TPA: hypothetical protein VG410_08810 [Solirubrobacteraceae bacterium]|nr:hypothetical protein [Solirubrobacteraceae bacterium]
MSRSRFPIRTPVFALAAIAAVAVVAVVIVLVATGGGSSTPPRGPLESMFQDDQYVLYQSNPVVVEKTLRTLKALGVERVRVQVLWVALAPDPVATKPPPGFNGADPNAYLAAGWAPYDRMVRITKSLGMGVNFDLTAPGPLWAMRQGDPDKATVADYGPSVSRFAQFVTAVARRYSGTYTPPGSHAGPLPRVNSWSLWNEPNQPGWLSPQLRTVGGVRVPDAPRLYREYANAGFNALVSTGHGPSTDTVLIGETAPEGCIARGPGCRYLADDQPIAPLLFLRAMYCVDSNYKPLRGSLAIALHCPLQGDPSAFVNANPALFDASGYAHHPYSLVLAPNIRFPSSDVGFVSLANLSALERALDQIFATYGVGRQLPIYLTEYGYETNPPNPVRGVSPQHQAAWLDQAQYMAWKDPRVRALSQFLLVDSLPDTKFPVNSSGYWSTFQTGLEYANGGLKPSFLAYLLPIYLPVTSFQHGNSLLVWAMLRPAPSGSKQHALVQWRALGGGSYRTLANVTTNDASNVLEAHVQPPGSGMIRIQWRTPAGLVLDSRPVAIQTS